MTKETQVNNGVDVDVQESNPVMNYIWISGIILASLCLLLQLLLFIILPKIRKTDQKILLQLTIAGLMNTVLEYVMTKLLFNKYTRDLTFALYLQTEAVVICWMSAYTKHLYDKVVIVLPIKVWNFLHLSLLVWLLPVLLGIGWPVCFLVGYFYEYYEGFAWIKLIVLTVNVVIFCKIFYVIVNTSKDGSRKFADVIKTCVISFILLSITSLQALLQCLMIITDILDFFAISYYVFEFFFVFNSLRAVGVTIIFLILTNSCNKVVS